MLRLQPAVNCPTAVVNFERTPGLTTPYPVDVLAIFRLKTARAVGHAGTDGKDADATTGSTAGDYAWVHSYDYVFADWRVAKEHWKFTHDITRACEYVYLSDVYELLPVERLRRPALLVTSTSQSSKRDLVQHGNLDSKRVSQVADAAYVRTHFYYINEPL